MLQYFYPCFPLDGLAGYIVHSHGFFFYIRGSLVESHPIDLFDWLSLEEMIHNMASKQAPLRLIKQRVWLPKTKDKYTGVKYTMSLK